jgi:hypothetical protein
MSFNVLLFVIVTKYDEVDGHVGKNADRILVHELGREEVP